MTKHQNAETVVKPSTIKIEVTPYNGVKCPRCWHYHYLAGQYDDLCDSCQLVILEAWQDHESYEKIKEARELEKHDQLG